MMRKVLSIFLIILLLISASSECFASSTGTVTASSLNMRKSASADSKVIKVLKSGNEVTILSSSGSWYKVKSGSNTGYVAKKYIKVSSSNKSSDTSSSKKSTSSCKTCSPGDKGDNVKNVQKRLKELGYYSGSIDGDYGNGTKTAVINFQKKNGLKSNGYVNSSTLSKLNSSSAKKAGSSSDSSSGSSGSSGTCSPGDTGDKVKKVQKRLKALGYYSGSVDGDYGNGTKIAVKEFQKNNGLSVNGNVNSSTLSKLNSTDARKASASSNGTESLNWFNGGSSKIPKGATFKVKDIKTGKVFTCKRWSGANHLDAEPLTASDTATMKSIFGHWSWKRRAVLVKYNGHVYAASMNGMPHGTQTIKNNNFDGHFCIHFTGSKTHASGKVDSTHQNCVQTALKHSW